ncbi:tripartite tricarboxylate transporter TctB family protein [Aestuariivirga sp.]|uniref:tripartite tricarboxylate transporter TctB family protein n=1 Tax=Aestuariivirga sp. TaxID=2650926 RepID=UPI0035936B7F
MNSARKISGAGLAIGLGLITLAGVIGLDAAHMQVPPSYARVGPQVFPAVIAIGLFMSGLAVAWQAWRGVKTDEEAEQHPTEWRSVAIIAVALIAHLNLLKPLGFVPAGAMLFTAVAFAFGSRSYLRDVLIGLALSLAAYIGFGYGLGLQLPPGILKGLL